MGVLLHKMKGILASVTSCIGGVQERYVVCVKAPAGVWYAYKLHADFVALHDDLHALAAATACAQECWLAPLLVSLKSCLDPSSADKLLLLNQFLQKLMAVQSLQSTETHADVCLLRPKIDAQLKTFLEWKDDVGVKRTAGSECIVLQPPGRLRRTHFSIIQSSKVVVPTPSLGSPLKARRLDDLAGCRRPDDALPGRRRVYTEVNFDGI
ncbi:hypothetical protein ACHHYP_16823 [Achlya hypogyna]|uniref:PX domain-containing protein n=1 Tax=Achlya hypogyna TaxID=1202772 RepID=A0A1V9Y5S8_ACHHY|nr:hypothetical protein ACHHYP_16823 [Achlya hypogyna]